MIACARCQSTDNQERIASIAGMWLCETCWPKRKCDGCGQTAKTKNRAHWHQPMTDGRVLCWRCL